MSNLTIKTPADAVAAALTLLGFVPTESLVMITFGSPNGSFSARVDLPARGDCDEVTGLLHDAAVTNGVQSALLLTFTDAGLSVMDCAESVGLAFIASGIRVHDSIRVNTSGDIYPADSNRVIEVMPGDHPFFLSGRPVLADRAAVAAALATNEDTSVLAERISETKFSRLNRGDADSRLEDARWLADTLTSYKGLELDDEDAALVLSLIEDDGFRDVALATISRENASLYVELWSDLLRRTPKESSVPVAALLGFSAWQNGDGALAWIAVDRGSEVNDQYTLLGLVATMLHEAVPPMAWGQVDLNEVIEAVTDTGVQSTETGEGHGR